MIQLGGPVGSAPMRTAGWPGSNPGSGENFSLKISNIELTKWLIWKPNFH